jgi:hypothetical protein
LQAGGSPGRSAGAHATEIDRSRAARVVAGGDVAHDMRETVVATGRRVVLVYLLVVLAFLGWRGGGVLAGPLLRVVLTLGILLSVAGGVEYLIFQGWREVTAAERDGTVTIYHYYGVTAAAIFATAQVVAAAQLAAGFASYFFWLAPALAYLFSIGVIGWLRFGRPAMFVADSVRSVGLLLLALLYNRIG